MNLSPVSPDHSTGTWSTQPVAWLLAPEALTLEKVFGHILRLSPTEETCNHALQSLSDLEQLHIRSFVDIVARTHDAILQRGLVTASATVKPPSAAGEAATPIAENGEHANTPNALSACSELSSLPNDDGQDEQIDTELAYGSELSSPPNNDHENENIAKEKSTCGSELSSPPNNDHENENIAKEKSTCGSVVSGSQHDDNEAEHIDEEKSTCGSVVSGLQHDDNEAEHIDEEPSHEFHDYGEPIVDAIKQPRPDIGINSQLAGSDKGSLCQTLLSQTDGQFAHESYLQIQRMSLSETSETCQGLLDALQPPHEDENVWSDGSRWATIIEAGDSDYRVASIRTAIRFAGYARWHVSQASCLERTRDMSTIQASQSVFERVLGHKPKEPGAEQKEWKRRRQRLSTCCTRGKKWLRLVDVFGSGILFKDVWALVKLREEDLSNLIHEGIRQTRKMEVLQLLTGQLKTLSNTGRTDPEEFRKQLTNLGYDDPFVRFTTTNDEKVDDFIRDVRDSTTSDMLCIPYADFQFGLAALNRLGPHQWFNDDLLLACLHLSTRMPSLRIGFSVPIHRQTTTRGGSLLPDPFQRASILISEHRDDQSRNDQSLVWLFPLLQRNNHFSLLEINEGDRRIYHYDSMNEGGNHDIKKACEEEFTEFEYIEQNVVQQHDLHSCGPLVIRNARDRMMGRRVAESSSHPYDPMELRAEALTILQSAWKDGALTCAPKENTCKKRKSNKNGMDRAHKRRKSRQEILDLTSD